MEGDLDFQQCSKVSFSDHHPVLTYSWTLSLGLPTSCGLQSCYGHSTELEQFWSESVLPSLEASAIPDWPSNEVQSSHTLGSTKHLLSHNSMAQSHGSTLQPVHPSLATLFILHSPLQLSFLVFFLLLMKCACLNSNICEAAAGCARHSSWGHSCHCQIVHAIHSPNCVSHSCGVLESLQKTSAIFIRTCKNRPVIWRLNGVCHLEYGVSSFG